MTLEGVLINTMLFSEPEYFTKYDLKTIPFPWGLKLVDLNCPKL